MSGDRLNRPGNSPEVQIHTGGYEQSSVNPYINVLTKAGSEGRFEEFYREERRKLEYRLSFTSGSLGDNQVAESINRDIQNLDRAYEQLKHKDKAVQSQTASLTLLSLFLFLAAVWLLFLNYQKNATIEAQKNVIEQKTQELGSTSDKLRSQLTNEKEGNKKLLDMLEAMKLQKNALSEQNAELAGGNKKLAEDYKKLSESRNETEKERDSLRIKVSGLETDKKNLEADKRRLENDKRNLETENRNLNTKNTELLLSNADLKAAGKKNAEEIASLKKKQEAAEKKSRELSEANTRASASVSNIEAENARQKKTIQTLEAEKRTLASEKENLSKEVTRLLKSNTQYFQELREIKKQCRSTGRK